MAESPLATENAALSKRAANYLAWISSNPGQPAPIQSGTREAVTLRGLVKRGLVTVEDGRMYPRNRAAESDETP